MKKIFTVILLVVFLPLVLWAQVDFSINDWGRVRLYDPTGTQQLDRVSIDFAVDQNNVYMYKDVGITLPFEAPMPVTATVSDSEVVSSICWFNGTDTIAVAEQHIYQWFNENFLMVKFRIYNYTAAPIPNYVSFEIIPKVSNAYGDEIVDYDAANEIGYCFKGTDYIGTKLLSQSIYSYRSLFYSDYSAGSFADSTMWANIIDPTNTAFPFSPLADGSASFHNAGAYNLGVADTLDFYIAIAYGTSLAELQTEMIDAMNLYNQITSIEEVEIQPVTFQLRQNYPNPFNPETNIPFSLEKMARVNLEVFNILGQKVATIYEGQLSAGDHLMKWNGLNASGQRVESGIYFYRLNALTTQGMKSEVQKMILSK